MLGVDPGLGRTGVALVTGRPGALSLAHIGCLETTPHTPEGARLASLRMQMLATLDECRPEVAGVESLYFSSNRSTAISVAQARGVVMCALAEAGCAAVEYAPNQVKEAVCGYGGARKPQVARMVGTLLGGERPRGHDDATDACAIAICHHHRALGGRAVTAGALSKGDAMSPALAAAVTAARAAEAHR